MKLIFPNVNFDSRNINDDFNKMCSKLILLDDEFSGKGRKEVQQFKDITSRDRFYIRLPFSKFHQDMKRLAVMCGTSNELEILSDMTGKQRRIIPITLEKVDLEKFNSINKTDLFMEMYHEWQKDPDWFMLGREEIEELDKRTSKNRDVTQEEALIRYFLSKRG